MRRNYHSVLAQQLFGKWNDAPGAAEQALRDARKQHPLPKKSQTNAAQRVQSTHRPPRVQRSTRPRG